MTIDLTAPEFHDEDKAREWLEQSRWPNGVNCPHCGSLGVIRLGYDIPKAGSKGKAHRPGLFHCRGCRGQFTVCTGHVMESSHVKLTKWVLAMRLLAGSKKGMSAHQLHRSIKVTYKTAWFMFHRLREGVSSTNAAPLGGDGKIVEADEAYFGKRKTAPVLSRGRVAKPTKGGGTKKRPIVALVERAGEVRARHILAPAPSPSAPTLDDTALNCSPATPPLDGLYRIYNQSPRLASLVVKTKPGAYYLVKLQNATSHADVVSAFVRGGQPLRIGVPLGIFVLKYAAGESWCGDRELFGPDTTVSIATDTFRFDRGDEWTVELILQPNGNLQMHSIPRSEF